MKHKKRIRGFVGKVNSVAVHETVPENAWDHFNHFGEAEVLFYISSIQNLSIYFKHLSLE